ncbi:SRPBCC domain-containing protein [Aeromicrobium sp.]|uniref:SRPBCC family protein n=1 Tax=Aeromicrobium sp. TaxID=1871063 RepID=UPI003512AE35
MPVTDVRKDLDQRTLTITAEFAAPVERVFDIYADPRQLERVWGPPSFPATFVDHDLSEGGRITYYMTGPEGQRFGGWWEVTAVDAPHGFDFRDGFADDDLQPVEGMPVSTNSCRFEPIDGGTRAVYTSTYATLEALQQVIDMGVEEGSRLAIDQIDVLLAA